MKIKDFYDKIEDIALQHPDVHTFYKGDVYDLNTRQDTVFSACVLTVMGNRDDMDNDIQWMRCNLFYVDRLTDDGGGNAIDVQSHAVDVLRNILRLIQDDFELQNVEYQVFTERFLALCGGAYVSVEVGVPIDECAE